MPFYLNGRAPQRSLLLRWIEEMYGSKEPVQPGGLTIEHVLPQSPTAAWLDVLAGEVEDDEEPEDVHERLVHTLGNLTLTRYNSTLSNSPFETKRAMLATSGVAMNQEVAAEQRWGKAEILARADRLADRLCAAWPAPLVGVRGAGKPAWDMLEAAVAALPAGSWTSYKDLAALIGSHQVQRVANHELPNAHRVRKSLGRGATGVQD